MSRSYQLKSHTQEIDQVRTRIWIAELRSHTGIEAVHALASLFDPESTWRDGSGIPHQAKWYRYQHGTAVPSMALTTKVKSSMPSLEFDVHHPAWTLLRNPTPSPRTLTRIVKKLPRQWTKSMNRLALDTFKHRNICLDLVTGARFSAVDEVLRSSRNAYRTKLYLLAMSLLWDDPDDAINACLQEATVHTSGFHESGANLALKDVLMGESINKSCRRYGVHLRDFEFAFQKFLKDIRPVAHAYATKLQVSSNERNFVPGGRVVG